MAENSASKAAEINNQITAETKLGDLRKWAKEIKKDHDLALELWSKKKFLSRQLAILILDKKQLNETLIDQMLADMEQHESEEKLHLVDWLMANQLSKDKKTVAMMESWETADQSLKRRLFWYHQARLRWMGKTDQENTLELLDSIENNMMKETSEVQWAMNFTAGQIGKWQPELRKRCIDIGEKTGLYKDEVVPRGCTPSYLPKFIEIEVGKIKK